MKELSNIEAKNVGGGWIVLAIGAVAAVIAIGNTAIAAKKSYDKCMKNPKCV